MSKDIIFEENSQKRSSINNNNINSKIIIDNKEKTNRISTSILNNEITSNYNTNININHEKNKNEMDIKNNSEYNNFNNENNISMENNYNSDSKKIAKIIYHYLLLIMMKIKIFLFPWKQ